MFHRKVSSRKGRLTVLAGDYAGAPKAVNPIRQSCRMQWLRSYDQKVVELKKVHNLRHIRMLRTVKAKIEHKKQRFERLYYEVLVG